MEKTKKDAGKDQRVVLNLSTIQAEQILGLLKTEQSEIARKVCIRIQKTLHKQAIAAGNVYESESDQYTIAEKQRQKEMALEVAA